MGIRFRDLAYLGVSADIAPLLGIRPREHGFGHCL